MPSIILRVCEEIGIGQIAVEQDIPDQFINVKYHQGENKSLRLS